MVPPALPPLIAVDDWNAPNPAVLLQGIHDNWLPKLPTATRREWQQAVASAIESNTVPFHIKTHKETVRKVAYMDVRDINQLGRMSTAILKGMNPNIQQEEVYRLAWRGMRLVILAFANGLLPKPAPLPGDYTRSGTKKYFQSLDGIGTVADRKRPGSLASIVRADYASALNALQADPETSIVADAIIKLYMSEAIPSPTYSDLDAFEFERLEELAEDGFEMITRHLRIGAWKFARE